MIIGGHLTPALALLDHFLNNGIDNILWVGVKHVQKGSDAISFEYTEVNKRGVIFIELKAGKLWRKWTIKTVLHAIVDLIRIPLGFLNSFLILLKYRPNIVIGFGGYLQFPVLFLSKFLRIKTAIHEQTITAGSSNLACKRCADIIFVSWPETLELFPKGKTILVGNPIREFLFDIEPRKVFDNNKPVILVTGGNQGANTINWRLLEFLPDLLLKCNVIHQIGNSTTTNDYDKALKLYESIDEKLRSSYKFFTGDFTSNFAFYLKSADLIVSRSGANTITEILVLGKRAILIPIPWSSYEEQQKNAEMVERTGLGYVLKQYDAMPSSELQNAILLGLKACENNTDFKGRDIEIAVKEARALINKDACKSITEKLFSL